MPHWQRAFHPIRSVAAFRRLYGKAIDQSRVTDVQEVSGKGVIKWKVDGRTVVAGNAKLMELEGIPYQECHSVGTVVHMAVDGEYVGHILIADRAETACRRGYQSTESGRYQEDRYADRRCQTCCGQSGGESGD